MNISPDRSWLYMCDRISYLSTCRKPRDDESTCCPPITQVKLLIGPMKIRSDQDQIASNSSVLFHTRTRKLSDLYFSLLRFQRCLELDNSLFFHCQMDGGFRLLCQTEGRRVLLLMAVTVALVLVVQNLELPYVEVFTSLFSAVGNNSSFPTGESSSKSGMIDNMMVPSGLNSSFAYAVNGKVNSTNASEKEKENALKNKSKEEDRGRKNDYASESHEGSGLVSNGTLNSTLENAVANAPAPEKFLASEQDFSSEQNVSKDNNSSLGSGRKDPVVAVPAPSPLSSDTKLRSSITSMNSNMSSAAKNAADIPSKKRNPVLQSSNPFRSVNVFSANKVPGEKPKKKSKKQPKVRVSIAEMNDLLLQSYASPHSVAPRWSSEVDQEIISAKIQIESAPTTKSEPGIYPPLYRNISMFERSYELMEKMLKVYIYPDGEKPIFHQAILEGIYASEGWFMNLLEANKKHVTKDPQKAHLFYLPFSSRLLELTLYARNSHSRKNLIQYVASYVDMIAAKYPFWNRTSGADHFLAACHDWAPAETRGRLLNCIRALCNADIEAGFTIGKDVSLPETFVRSAQNPLKNMGGNPPSQRHILAFFAGNMHGYLRPILLDFWGQKDPDMKVYGPMPQVKGNTNYIEHMKSSKYCICARGYEVNSPRLVEAIMYECVPVIISDNFVPPFFEVLNWESFAVFVSEKDIPNLKNILLSISEDKYVEMHKRVKKVQQHFLWHAEPVQYDLFHMILHSVWYNRIFRMKTP